MGSIKKVLKGQVAKIVKELTGDQDQEKEIELYLEGIVKRVSETFDTYTHNYNQDGKNVKILGFPKEVIEKVHSTHSMLLFTLIASIMCGSIKRKHRDEYLDFMVEAVRELIKSKEDDDEK